MPAIMLGSVGSPLWRQPGGAAAGGADLTALAVQAGNLRAAGAPSGPSAAAPPPAPAVTIDPRTVALANAASGAAPSSEPPPGAGVAGRAALVGQARREMVEDAERSVLRLERHVAQLRDTVRILEETGEVWVPQMDRTLGPARADMRFEAHGGPAGYIDALRRGIVAFVEHAIPSRREMAQQLRADYEARFV
jgi:hypothetical protein